MRVLATFGMDYEYLHGCWVLSGEVLAENMATSGQAGHDMLGAVGRWQNQRSSVH